MASGVSASRFYMWRAIVAMIHADGVVTPHEVNFIQEYTKDVPLSDPQKSILARDIAEPQDIYTMFSQIAHPQDKQDFFALARILCWSDGDFQQQERAIMQMLEKIHSDTESQKFLKGSREDVQEISLDADQWRAHPMPANDSKLAGFLKAIKNRG